MTISLPPGMAKQMAKIQKQEHRTRSELLREAWRLYFESRYPVHTPTKAERTAIDKGRAEFERGEYVALAKCQLPGRGKYGCIGSDPARDLTVVSSQCRLAVAHRCRRHPHGFRHTGAGATLPPFLLHGLAPRDRLLGR